MEKEIKEILGLVKEQAQSNKDIKEEVEKIKEESKKMEERLTSEQKAFMEKMEREPVKAKLTVPGTDRNVEVIYRGYDLRKQARTIEIADPERKELYAKWMLNITRAIYANDAEAKAALNETTAAQGGYLVPDEFGDEIFALSRQQSVMLQDARIINMSRDSLKYPAESTHMSGSWKGESATLDESEPTFGEVEFNPNKYGAYAIATEELLEDSAFDIVSYITEDLAEDIGQEIDKRGFQAGGSSTFVGALSGAGTTTTQTSAGGWTGFSFKDLSNMIAQIPANHAQGAKFYLHRTALHQLRSKNDDNGQPIFARPGNGVPGTIYEYPYQLVEQFPYTNSTGNYIFLFGNLRNYGLAIRRLDMVLRQDPYGLFTKDQVRFKMTVRVQGKPINANGLVSLKGKT